MGGGTVWRGVARLVSPAVRVASASSSNSCSFCKVGASAQAPKAQSARLRSCACTPETTPKAESASQQGALTLWEPDEWEFAEEEERVDHLVFGSLPSRKEVEEASSELQNALRLGLVAPASDPVPASQDVCPPVSGQSRLSGEFSVTEDNDAKEVSKPLVATQMALDWLEPPPILTGQGVLQAGERNNVAEAFHQFQHNPEVQNMVVSLATDPAVWDAVLANEKIQEFKRKLQGDKGLFADKDPMFADSGDETSFMEHTPNFFSRFQSFWQGKLLHFMDVITNIISGFFKAADKKVFAEEDGDFLDRTVKSCTMLALIVVCVVILKRLAVQAA